MMTEAREYLTLWMRQNSVSRIRWLGRSLSFTFIWTWCALLARTDIFPTLIIDTFGLTNTGMPLLASNVVVLLILIVTCWKMTSLLDSRMTMIITAIFLSLASLLVVSGEAYRNLPLCYVGVFFGGAAIATLKISWGEMYSRVRLDEGLMLLGVALIVSSLLTIVSFVLPAILTEMLFVLCGILCVPFLYFGTRQQDYIVSEIRRSRRQKLNASWTFLALPILVALTFGAFHGVTRIDPEQITGFEAFVSPGSTFISGILLIVVAIRFENHVKPAQIYAWALVMVVTGLVLSVINTAFPLISNIILVTGFQLFYFFMIVFWGNLAKRMGRSIVVAYLIGYTSFQTAQLAGNLLSLYVLDDLSFQGIIAFVLSVILLFFTCVLLLYGSVNSPFRIWLMADSSQETSDDISDACALISRKYRLTPREHEILTFLARGRNASHIVSMQNISYETARTHIKNIHRKLDVHSQQATLDFIDRVINEGIKEL
jgi:DNA-binding CsgD family transcriptional regulator